MYRNSKAVIAVLFSILILFAAMTSAKPNKAVTTQAPAILWRQPADVASRNLYYGPGGRAHEPHGPFTFEKEDPNGTNPKFDVVDGDGVKWRVKLGPEARPETVASRLVWSAGYFANEDYFMPVLQVQKMGRLRRGRSLVSADGTVHDVRLKRHAEGEKKIGTWSWSKNPFTDTGQWYGLRVLMALMNNWDLKDINNAIYVSGGESGERRYMISDLGASFGPTGLDNDLKGNTAAYCKSKWIKNVSAEYVDFNVPSAPAAGYFLNFVEMGRRLSLLWLGRHIPREHARWMGDQLARLSHEQIRDAFRAGGYSPSEIEELTGVVEQRIHELQKL